MELVKEVNETGEETKQCSIQLVKSKHVKYLTRMLKVLPEALATMETTRMTLVYFTISALDVLGELDQVISQKEKSSMIDWIYRLQVHYIFSFLLSNNPFNLTHVFATIFTSFLSLILLHFCFR